MATTIGLVFEEIGELEKFKCPHCEKEYATQENLDKHIKGKHADEEV